jgi:hypothetical protein
MASTRSRDKDVEEPMASVGDEHDRAQRRLGAALAEQHRSGERYDAAVGGTARLRAAVALHVADQEVAARDAWLRWVDDDGSRGLNAGPFELRRGTVDRQPSRSAIIPPVTPR